MNTEGLLDVLPAGPDVCLMSRPTCVGKCLFGTPGSVWDSVLVFLVEGFVTVLSSGVWVCMPFV